MDKKIKKGKSHETGLRILEVLKILLNEDSEKRELMRKLSEINIIENVKTNEVYTKYFNTLEMIGLKIVRVKDEYILKNALYRVDLTSEEEKLLIKLISLIPKLNNLEQEELARKIVLKIDRYVSLDLRSELEKLNKITCNDNVNKNVITTLKQLMQNNNEINVTYKRIRGIMTIKKAKIKKIIEKNDVYSILCYSPDLRRSRRIYVKSILDIEIYPVSPIIEDENEVAIIFEVYGRLSKSYKIKSWETLEAFGNECLRIVNKEEDIESFLLRMLKYGSNCKIISPQFIVDDFLALTQDVERNLTTIN